MRTQNLNSKIPTFETGYLTLVGSHVKKIYEVTNFTSIGRDEGSQISLTDASISARHARIEKREDGYYIKDMRSRNGTFLNGAKVLEAKLQDRDRLRVGLTEFIFSTEKDMGLLPVFTNSQNSDWNQQLARVPAIAQSPHPVLLLGPSGTGKEVLASMIHKLSTRSKGPFISVNCSALTEALAESELFGHIKGSFTGAQEDRKGAFEASRNGTLFLDEIGDMPLGMQPKFLRALENNEIKPVGSDTTHAVDARIIAATNRDLKTLVNQGKFREDLYFRLHILQIRPPALMERMEDFDMLLQHFARQQKVHFSSEAIYQLRKYSWPGNIRELKNTVSRAAALYPGLTISEVELPDLLDEPEQKMNHSSRKPGPLMAREFLKEYEKDVIIEKLAQYYGNQRLAAKDLGFAKSTLHDRIRQFEINLAEFKKNKPKKVMAL